MRQPLTQEAVERALRAARDLLQNQEDAAPHNLIEELVGLEAYRRAMDCPEMETLAAYAEDALSLDDALQTASHLRWCPVCRADAEELRGFVRQQVPQILASAPLWTTPFVGRNAARETLSATLRSGNAQTVTLAAPSGLGKTRLTLETAVEYAFLFPDGVWYVPLTGRDEAALVAEIAQAVKLPLQSKSRPMPQVQEFFADKRALLILDDAQLGSPAASVITQLTEGAQGLCCLTTATEALGLAGERTLPLPPLPSRHAVRDPERLLAEEDVQLFLAHVRAFRPDMRLEEQDVLAVSALCDRAAGVPLAIELVAARSRERTLEELQRGAEAMPVVARPDESLRALLNWSVGLLTERERRCLQRLSVFADGFFVEQAAVICEEDEAETMVESLTQKALLQRLERQGRTRYQVLSPVRDYARRELGAEAEATRQRHARYFLSSARERAECLEETRQVEAVQALSDDLPNLRAGIEWAQEIGDREMQGEYGLAVNRFLMLQGFWEENVTRLREAEAAFHLAKAAEGEKQVRLALARSLTFQGEYGEAESLLMRLIAEADAAGDLPTAARAYQNLGGVAQFRGRYAPAVGWIEEALKRFAALQDRWGQADCWHNLGRIAWMQGDYPRAETLLTDSLAVQRERGDRYRLGTTLAVLGNIAHEQARLEEARVRFAEALELRQELGDLRGIASSLNNLGMVWQALEDIPRADYCLMRAIGYLEGLGDRRTLGQTYGQYGELALSEGNLRAARERFERSLYLLDAVGSAHEAMLTVGQLVRVAAQEGNREEALRLVREWQARREALGLPVTMEAGFEELERVLADVAREGSTEKENDANT